MGDRHLDGMVKVPSAQDRYDRPWRGRVTRLDQTGDFAWVLVPGIAPGHEFGPCDIRGVEVTVGDSALVVFLGGNARDPAIVRRLQVPLAAGAGVGASPLTETIDTFGVFEVTLGTIWGIDASGLPFWRPEATTAPTEQASYGVDADGLPYLRPL